MPRLSTIQHFYSPTPGAEPTGMSLGEIAVNTADQKLFVGGDANTFWTIGATEALAYPFWIGKSDGTAGVSLYEAAGVGVIYGSARDNPTVVANTLVLSGVSTSLNSTTGNVNINSGGTTTIDSVGTFAIEQIGRAFDSFQLTTSQLRITYNTATESSAFVVGSTSGAISYQSPSQAAMSWSNSGVSLFTPGYATNPSIAITSANTRLRFNDSAQTAILINSAITFSATNGIGRIYLDGTNILFRDSAGVDKLSVSTYLRMPNIPANSPGPRGVWLDNAGYLRISE